MKLFGFIHKKLLNIVMGFTANHMEVGNIIEKTSPELTKQFPANLSVRELEIILTLIKKSSFLGEDIEVIYNMIIKLQNQYLEQTKQ
jgi:hypothetical protein